MFTGDLLPCSSITTHHCKCCRHHYDPSDVIGAPGKGGPLQSPAWSFRWESCM